MFAIFKKEFRQFFSSLTGYVAIVVFLLATGLFIWVFPDTSVLDFGYASLDSLFYIAPYVLLFLLPAITMRSFAEEIQQGTIELLFTRPLKAMDLVMGKYLATVAVAIIAIIPTFIYVFTLWQLGMPAGNLDMGGIIGSYIGLVFLSGAFAAIGIFCSSLSGNQIVAFLMSVFLCFFVFQGFEYLSKLGVFLGHSDAFVQGLGINAHYNSISRGIVDTRDLAYFISLIAVFVFGTKWSLEGKKR